MRYRFFSHTLDIDRRQLLVEGAPVHLEPRTLAVLIHLVQNRHRVVTKEELLDAVWGDRFVSESALTTRVKHLRRALGDDGSSQQAIRTVHRVGYQFLPEVEQEAVPAPPARASPPPTAAQTLFGRDADVAALADRVRNQRLVTVTGPAGVGKTALAGLLLSRRDELNLESVTGGGAERVWLCELANTRQPVAVPNVVLDAFGHGQHSDADPVESLARTLERRSALLVLDNCEHLADAAAALVESLLRRCPGLHVVATSRVPLGVPGESVLVLDTLELDSAMACFVARSADAGAHLRTDDPALPELCRRLDQLPLALELAAARARLLGLDEMVELLADRFRLLGRQAPGDGRYSSLDEAIAWSWESLDVADRELLAALTVLAGSFSLEEAAWVAGVDGDTLDLVDGLQRLVGVSLLTTRAGPVGRVRFLVLESVRDFAAARLEDVSVARRRHAHHFADLAERLDVACQTEQLDDALAAFGVAWDNLRAAVRYAADAEDRVTVRRIVRAVGGYADLVQAYEVLDWCRHAALDGPGDGADRRDPDVDGDNVWADALAVQARMLAHRGDQDHARRQAATAHAAHESHGTLLAVVWCAYQDGDLQGVVEAAPRLVELSRSRRGLDRGFAEGFSAIVTGVRQVAELEATTTSPADAAKGALGALDCLTAGLRLCAADPERAAQLLEAVVESSLRTDHRLLLGVAGSSLTQLTLPARPAGEAMLTLRRTLRRYLDRGMWVLISADTVMAAKLLADAGDVETACRLLGARRASGYRVGLSEVLRALVEDELATALGSRCADLMAEGEGWTPPDAAEAALAALDRCLLAAGSRPDNSVADGSAAQHQAETAPERA